MLLPFFAAQPIQALLAHIVLERAFLVAESAQLQRFDDAVHDYRGAEAGAQAEDRASCRLW